MDVAPPASLVNTVLLAVTVNTVLRRTELLYVVSFCLDRVSTYMNGMVHQLHETVVG
jgi:hypothetical protein